MYNPKDNAEISMIMLLDYENIIIFIVTCEKYFNILNLINIYNN